MADEDNEKTVRLETKHVKIGLMIAILIFGFYLRIYHINYPVIGYHNWKETHYLTEARNFARDGFFKSGFFVPRWAYPYINSDPSGAHSDTFPTTPILAAISFMIFGYKLWAARIIGILMTTASITLIYLIVKEIFKREDMAFSAAFLTAINPLFVFFSHNVQLVNPGLFFMLLSLYIFLLWRRDRKNSQFILSTIFLALATLTKYPFLITVFPIIFLFPLEEIRIERIKKNFYMYLISFVIMLSIPAWMLYISSFSKEGGVKTFPIKPEEILSEQFWNSLPSYINDSITWVGFYFAILGIIILALVSLFKGIDRPMIFLWGCFLSILIFVPLMVAKLKGHSYHYYPIMPFIIVFISYALIKIGDFSSRLKIEGKRIRHINIILVILLLLIFIPSAKEAIDRQFNTQFFGHDIAGEYLKEHNNEGDRLMHSSHQAYGVLWHADMMGTRGIPMDVETIKFAEENLNASWIYTYNFCYPRGQVCFDVYQNPEVWDYISKNYRLVQVAFTLRNGRLNVPIYFLFKKGGSFKLNDLPKMIMNKSIAYKDYEYTMGRVRIAYINIEE